MDFVTDLILSAIVLVSILLTSLAVAFGRDGLRIGMELLFHQKGNQRGQGQSDR